MSILKKLLLRGKDHGNTPIGLAFDALSLNLRNSGREQFTSSAGSSLALGLEGFADNQMAQQDLESTINGLESCLAGLEGYSDVQKEAAMAAAMISGNIAGHLKNNKPVPSDFIKSHDDLGRISAGLESYDEKENRAASIFTVTYNLRAARQDEFGEAFYPTVVVAPDQQGYIMHINLINLISAVRRKSSGAEANWNRHNIVHVIRNPDLIDSSSTKLVPVYRDDSKQHFVDVALVANSTVEISGETVTTSPLAIGKEVELIGISQTALQLERDHMDETDSIDTEIALKNIYIKVGEDVLKYPTAQLPGAIFNYAVQGDQRRMDLRMETEALYIGANSKKADGADLVTLAPVVVGDMTVYLRILVQGSVMLDIGTTELSANSIRVVKLVDVNGDVFQPDSPAYASMVALFADAQVIGYDLDARRTNLNRRSQGQMLETRQNTQSYAVPLLAPFTIKRPLGLNDTTDQSDLASLVTLSRAMASGKAVDTLLALSETLQVYTKDARQKPGDNPRLLGVGSFLITAHYEKLSVHVDATTMTRNSAELAANIQATIVNVARDMIFRAYQESGWKAAADMLDGGESKKPIVVFGTDQTLGRYLQVTGDLRTIGGGFEDIKVVDTQNEKMKGKLFIAFMPQGVPEGTPHPLQLGNMAWKPEVAVVLPIHRNGANSKELTVQPSFIHVNNCPILMEIEVTGIPETVETRVPTKVEGEVTTVAKP